MSAVGLVSRLEDYLSSWDDLKRRCLEVVHANHWTENWSNLKFVPMGLRFVEAVRTLCVVVLFCAYMQTALLLFRRCLLFIGTPILKLGLVSWVVVELVFVEDQGCPLL